MDYVIHNFGDILDRHGYEVAYDDTLYPGAVAMVAEGDGEEVSVVYDDANKKYQLKVNFSIGKDGTDEHTFVSMVTPQLMSMKTVAHLLATLCTIKNEYINCLCEEEG